MDWFTSGLSSSLGPALVDNKPVRAEEPRMTTRMHGLRTPWLMPGVSRSALFSFNTLDRRAPVPSHEIADNS
jgi:hypothetical protein